MKIGPLQAKPPILNTLPAVTVTPRLGLIGLSGTLPINGFLKINLDMIFDHDKVEKVHHEPFKSKPRSSLNYIYYLCFELINA